MINTTRVLSTLRADASGPTAAVPPYDHVWVVIPARNEQSSLPYVLNDLPHVGRVLVVDNGSTDATASVALSGHADVIFQSRRGYGSACLAGLAHIDQLVRYGETRPDIIVFLDGDYSDHPDELALLVDPILKNEA
ncbi:MAG: glycosyltransferase family 2 protein, partial [Planctomycetota bacterium]|nr:glycosyltransferase family 2 protein [Planctomycetota bacterium]